MRNFLIPEVSCGHFACRQYRIAVRNSYGCIWIMQSVWDGIPRLLRVIRSSIVDASETMLTIPPDAKHQTLLTPALFGVQDQ